MNNKRDSILLIAIMFFLIIIWLFSPAEDGYVGEKEENIFWENQQMFIDLSDYFNSLDYEKSIPENYNNDEIIIDGESYRYIEFDDEISLFLNDDFKKLQLDEKKVELKSIYKTYTSLVVTISKEDMQVENIAINVRADDDNCAIMLIWRKNLQQNSNLTMLIGNWTIQVFGYT